MVRRSWALAVLLLMLSCGTALSAPVTVQLRVEGATSTIFEGPVTTDGHPVDGGDGTGFHPCDGTNLGAYPGPGPTMTAALDDGVGRGGWHGGWSADFQDFLIDTVGADSGTSFTSYWGSVLDYQPTPRGGCQMQVGSGADVLFALGDVYSQPLLQLAGPARARAGQPATVAVTNGKDGTPAEGAEVGAAVTGADGHASVTFAETGLVSLKATKAGSIRSNALRVCVSQSGTGDCGVPPQTLGSSTPKPVRDSRAPLARISGPKDGRRYRRGPRILSGVASDAESGVTEVKLAFRRHAHGGCSWWSGRRERFVGSNCHKKFFFAIGRDARWSYLLPHALPRGRYVLDVKAFDRARNRDERFERGRNRVVFYVGSRSGAGASSSTSGGPRVDVMIAGRDRLLAGAATVRARTVGVRAGRRSCKVGASTPLAALATLLRREQVAYRLRDYGNCSRRTAAGSGQLYVSRIGSERARGSDGWFYKVNDRAPEVGSADPAAATLRRGDRVLWFFCVFDVGANTCQRSLRALPDTGGGTGAPLHVRVRGYDNRGRSVAVPGATVRLGADSALTDAAGVAQLAAPKGGRQKLFTTKDGMVRSFPIEVDDR
jgi:hypothetical protein